MKVVGKKMKDILLTTMRFLGTVLLSVCGICSVNAADSALSLRDAIREVAEVTNVLPLDVYAGTTLSEYRNWNCRYDLTYSEFRPNYALYEIARNASVSEVLECVEELADMPAKEKALTCAALIAFVESQREKEARGIVPATGLNDDEKSLVLQKLEQELNDRAVAFPKADNAELNARWEAELREECGSYMALDRRFAGQRLREDDMTATQACFDLYRFPRKDDRKLEGEYLKYYRLLALWNNDTKQLPVDFLCALVLAQATYDNESLASRIAGTATLDKNESFKKFEDEKLNSVVECFKHSKTCVYSEWYDRKELRRELDPTLACLYITGESLIMNDFLKTQFVAARAGRNDSPVSGNSFSKDVSVSEVVQKAIDALLNDAIDANPTRALEINEARKDDEKGTRLSLLETIRNNVDESMFFDLPLFVDLFEALEQHKAKTINKSTSLDLGATYESCRPFCIIYEVAKTATHDEIVECLKALDELGPREKVLVMAAVTLYIVRSESPDGSKVEAVEALTDEEKEVFARCVRECAEDDTVAFDNDREAIEKSKIENAPFTKERIGAFEKIALEKWEASFRKGALLYQKKLGKWSPYYEFSPNTEERWTRFCEETPVVLLYSALAMETRCNLFELRMASTPKHLLDLDSQSSLYKEMEWTNEIEDEELLLETRIMRDYLFLTRELSRRSARDYFMSSGYSLVSPQIVPPPYFPLRLSGVVLEIMEKFPDMKDGKLPRLTSANDFIQSDRYILRPENN